MSALAPIRVTPGTATVATSTDFMFEAFDSVQPKIWLLWLPIESMFGKSNVAVTSAVQFCMSGQGMNSAEPPTSIVVIFVFPEKQFKPIEPTMSQ